MFKILILILTANLFFMLHATGNISKYINMKYSFLSASMIVILLILIVVEGIKLWSSGEEKENHHDCDCSHDHHDHEHHQDHGHEKKKPSAGKKIKKFLAYTLVLIPAITGVVLPVATLDSQLVDAKGFSFPTLEDGSNQEGMHQVLNPDMSKFMNHSDFEDLVRKESKSYIPENNIT
jgi:putative membrane protein